MKYIALLRGIGPGNPNMRSEKLKGVLDELGFKNVSTLISSGNVLFESESKDMVMLEVKIQKAWPEKLGFNSSTIIRSQSQLQDLIDHNPYKGAQHSRQSYQLVTFFKSSPKIDFQFPFKPEGKGYTLLGRYKDAIYSMADVADAKTPDMMVWLDKQFGKDITSRTYKTVTRILQKMG